MDVVSSGVQCLFMFILYTSDPYSDSFVKLQHDSVSTQHASLITGYRWRNEFTTSKKTYHVDLIIPQSVPLEHPPIHVEFGRYTMIGYCKQFCCQKFFARRFVTNKADQRATEHGPARQTVACAACNDQMMQP